MTFSFLSLEFLQVWSTGLASLVFLKRVGRPFFLLTLSTSSLINTDFLVAGRVRVPLTQSIVGLMAYSHMNPSKILSLFASFATLNFPIMVQSLILTVRMQYQDISPPAVSDPSAVITGNGLDSQ